ncbi:MAG: TIR domain-containing protein [Firmicutes bacterium]|nr:TIR domain-containing protein [Bacillota bacterium]
MAIIFKCKMCGGNLEVQEGMTVCECEYCGSIQTIPQLDDEKKVNLFTRANRLRSACEFDKAAGVYESIIAEFPEEAEAYWGLLLCKYGIEYVDDPKTGKKIPTCHRSSFDSIMDDPDFEMVMEYSDAVSRSVYRNEAKAIEELRKAIIEVSSKEEPYDIFICYKETDDKGERTIDSVIAQDVYDALTEKGYKVFFSRITLEDKLGQEYEPYIFAALNSAKIMLAFGTDYEYYNAVWVKNEWSRFLSLMEKGEKKTLIPCYKGIDAYDMPKEFARLQAQDMGKVGAIQDLLRGIGKIIGTKTSSDTVIINGTAGAEIAVLLQRGNMALEDKDYRGAEGYFERALDISPTEAQAYVGKLLASLKVSALAELKKAAIVLEENKDFRRAVQFADPELKKKLEEVQEANDLTIARQRFIGVVKKYRKKTIQKSLSSVKKDVYERLILKGSEAEQEAQDIYQRLVYAEAISDYDYSKLVDRIPLLVGISNVLRDFQEHTYTSIVSEKTVYKNILYVKSVLSELVEYGIVEENGDTYALTGAKEKRAAYDEACAKVRQQMQEEVDARVSVIYDKYESRLKEVQAELDKALNETDQQRSTIQEKISSLRNQQASLGLFKGKEKKALQIQIDKEEFHLGQIPSKVKIQTQYQPRINQIKEEKRAEVIQIETEVKAKYPLPTL